MSSKDVAARLSVLEGKVQSLIFEIRELFQEILDTEEVEE